MRRGHILTDDDEEEPLFGSQDRDEPKVKPWDVFKNVPRENESGSTVESKWIDVSIKILKGCTVLLVFCVVLGTAVISKGTFLFMTSQINKTVTREYCNKYVDKNRQFIVKLPDEERVIWMWMLMFAYFVPELGTFVRSVRICCFKTWSYPKWQEFVALFVTESLPAIGSALLVFLVLPELDVIKGAMLTNAVCFVPGVTGFFSRNQFDKDHIWKAVLDLIALIAQATAFIAWPLVDSDRPDLWAIPFSVLLISAGWWENFVSEKSPIKFLSQLATEKKIFENKKYFMYLFISLWKCLLFFIVSYVIVTIRENDAGMLFNLMGEAFSDRKINITEIPPIVGGSSIDFNDIVTNPYTGMIDAKLWTPLGIFLLNSICTYLCYAFGKFACKVMIQGFSFAFPINLTVPVLLSGLIAMCGFYNKDACYYIDNIPGYLFFNTLPLGDLQNFLSKQYSWIWLLWLLSQVWITMHIWTVNNRKLASTENLFMRPMYDAFLIDQSIAMNRRHVQEESKVKEDSDDVDGFVNTDNDNITRIFACGTMWHETKDEMMEFLKSVFRLDEDQCSQRIVRNYFGYNLRSYYELETHVFFDDAFVRVSENDNDPHINEYVEYLIETVEAAACKVHETNIRIRPPKIYPTPYGGRLVWTLPGKTKMIAHLKDKAKIRAKKRWSQVMYMYYLLGHRIMENDELSPERVGVISENTYLLALDGDIDFQPEAVHLLVDYMQRNKSLGAACGRIHPIGSGTIAWYQVFEYAVGHWLQKATEHVIGCVLCSPGCFSLFRAKALMDNNVMAKYTTKSEEARHYVQYDQGEDRWLCTLLLQRGYRVEYSAASDAFTHCPEGFNEFYNQRRRWMPSTMANILDLLFDYKHIVQINDNISLLYIFYQVILLIGTVIGPGTIFLMLVGAFVSAFKVSQMDSFIWNALPIIVFVTICACCKSDTQLFFAGIISGIYGLIMMAVFVGVMLQIEADGFLAPSSLFFFCIAGEFIITAMLHPKEFYCLKYGIIYYVTVPSMYMLLVIYSVFNMNNVSWGTREVTIVPKNNRQGKDKQPEVKTTQPMKKDNGVLSFFGDKKANAGSIEFSVANLFKCMWCTHQKDGQEVEKLQVIQTALQQIQQKLDYIERIQRNPDAVVEPRKTIMKRKTTTFIDGSQARPSMYKKSNDIAEEILVDLDDDEDDDSSMLAASDEIEEKSWYYDVDVDMRAEVLYLDKREEHFWKELIDRYLLPTDDTDKKDKIAKDLKDLRDKMVMTFFMVNALFVLVVFLLTLQKDTLHVNWPMNPKTNFTYSSNNGINEIVVQKEYLQLEPIGFIFLIFFGLLMIVQFLAMLIHRFGTFSQIISNTDLDLNLFTTNKIENLTEEEIFERDPVKICRTMIKLKGINDKEEGKEEHVARRNTAHMLALKKQEKIMYVSDLDKAFEVRMERMKNGDKDETVVPRKTFAAMNQRRQTVLRRQSEMPNVNREGLQRIIFDNPAFQVDSSM